MKRIKQSAIMLAAFLVTAMLMCACTAPVKFDGSKTGDADHFDLDFEVLNTSYTHDLDMKAGESIDVSIEKVSGKIALTIQKGDEEPVYTGNNLETTGFRVGISEDGTYTLTVSGEKAKGHVVLSRK